MWEAALAKVRGWFMGALKALPAVAVLQDKNDKLTADNVVLKRELDNWKDQLHQNRLMVQKLNERVQQLETRLRQLESPGP